MAFLTIIGIVCLSILHSECLPTPSIQPEQVHLSLGAKPDQMVVTWVTMQPTNATATVQYGQNHLQYTSRGYTSLFVDGGPLHRKLYIHRTLLRGLKPNTVYTYRCGTEYGWSEEFKFRTIPLGTSWSPRLAVFGDMGVTNAQSLPRLISDVQKGYYDAILHVGDMAYDMYEDNAMKGDEFMRMIEPLAANIPYMTCPGNHENAYNFSNYNNRFTMVNQKGEISNHFHSFDLGPAHIIAFSSEFYFYVQYGISQIFEQYKWLENELKVASDPKNRAQRPWIITMAHRPMYCSTKDTDDCTKKESIIRKGLEDLFYKYGVDLEIWAHEHVYERLFPVYDRKVYNGSYDEPYTNPRAPVHIITGSAGCRERTDPFVKDPAPWSAFRSSDYGYTRMKIINGTHLYIEQVSDDKDGQVIDKIMVIKEKHGPEAWL